jgi:hypothetical protein
MPLFKAILTVVYEYEVSAPSAAHALQSFQTEGKLIQTTAAPPTVVQMPDPTPAAAKPAPSPAAPASAPASESSPQATPG